MKKILYAAYGSNLNLFQMKMRCPTAKLRGTGFLKGYELQFKGLRSNFFATVAPQNSSEVPVGIWELQREDEFALDMYEGYPSHYYKETVVVEMDGAPVEAMIYIMRQNAQFGLPSKSYYTTVCEGYLELGFDPGYLRQAAIKSADNLYGDLTHRCKLRWEENYDETECGEVSENWEWKGQV